MGVLKMLQRQGLVVPISSVSPADDGRVPTREGERNVVPSGQSSYANVVSQSDGTRKLDDGQVVPVEERAVVWMDDDVRRNVQHWNDFHYPGHITGTGQYS